MWPTKYLGPYIYTRSVSLADCHPPPSKLVVPGSSAITMHTVAVSSLEGEKWVVWHAETKGSIVASVQSGPCSLPYPTSTLHLGLDACRPDGWRNNGPNVDKLVGVAPVQTNNVNTCDGPKLVL